MKDHFVASLEADKQFISYFLVSQKEIRTSPATGKSWLHLELSDRTGSIEAKMWDNFQALASTFGVDDVVKVQARGKLYRGKLELNIENIRAARPEEYDLADLVPQTSLDVEALYGQLKEHVAGVKNEWLRRLLSEIVEDEELARKLKRAPAGKMMHHAYLGGLLEHIVSLCGLVARVVPHYPELDADLLITAAVLHDIGKLDELSYQRSFGYTNEGLLVGHVVSGTELAGRKMDAIEGFPANLKMVVKHLILSHHGELEFGSPVVPKFPEAVLFHYLDQIDSKVAAMRETLAQPGTNSEWSARNASLGRQLLRLEKIREEERPAEEAGGRSGKLFEE